MKKVTIAKNAIVRPNAVCANFALTTPNNKWKSQKKS
jgi:hypothetical protein